MACHTAERASAIEGNGGDTILSYILFFVVSTIVVLLVLSRNVLGLMVIGLPLVIIVTVVMLSRRFRPEPPPQPMPVAPMGEPRTLEGRVDRMTVEDVEAETNPGTPWQGQRLASVFIIIISGIRYTLDPAPVRRGGYDWMSEGMWIRATFDRDTRVIYDIGPAQDPTKR